MDGKKEGIVNERLLIEIRGLNGVELIQILKEIPVEVILKYLTCEISRLKNFESEINNVTKMNKNNVDEEISWEVY